MLTMYQQSKRVRIATSAVSTMGHGAIFPFPKEQDAVTAGVVNMSIYSSQHNLSGDYRSLSPSRYSYIQSI